MMHREMTRSATQPHAVPTNEWRTMFVLLVSMGRRMRLAMTRLETTRNVM
jgi:hypothetical protein